MTAEERAEFTSKWRPAMSRTSSGPAPDSNWWYFAKCMYGEDARQQGLSKKPYFIKLRMIKLAIILVWCQPPPPHCSPSSFFWQSVQFCWHDITKWLPPRPLSEDQNKVRQTYAFMPWNGFEIRHWGWPYPLFYKMMSLLVTKVYSSLRKKKVIQGMVRYTSHNRLYMPAAVIENSIFHFTVSRCCNPHRPKIRLLFFPKARKSNIRIREAEEASWRTVSFAVKSNICHQLSIKSYDIYNIALLFDNLLLIVTLWQPIFCSFYCTIRTHRNNPFLYANYIWFQFRLFETHAFQNMRAFQNWKSFLQIYKVLQKSHISRCYNQSSISFLQKPISARQYLSFQNSLFFVFLEEKLFLIFEDKSTLYGYISYEFEK